MTHNRIPLLHKQYFYQSLKAQFDVEHCPDLFDKVTINGVCRNTHITVVREKLLDCDNCGIVIIVDRLGLVGIVVIG